MKTEYKTSQLLPVTEKEKMLVAATLRMCRGEAGQCVFSCEPGWRESEREAVYLNGSYRATPQKLPDIPWEWLPDDVVQVMVSENGVQCGARDGVDGSIFATQAYLKLDLDGVTLPCVVRRPESRVSECLSKPVVVSGTTIIDRVGDDVAELCPCVNGDVVARAINYHDELCDMVEVLMSELHPLIRKENDRRLKKSWHLDTPLDFIDEETLSLADKMLVKARGDANV